MRLWDNAKEFGHRAATGVPNGGLLGKLHRDVNLQDKLKDKIGFGGAGPSIVRKGVEQGYYSGLRKSFVPAKDALARARKMGQNAW